MKRGGMTLLEIVIAMLILGIGMTVIFQGLASGRDQVGRIDVLLCGRWLCQSILDQVVDETHNKDMRFYKLDSPPEVFLMGNTTGGWKKPFEALARKRTRLLDENGKPGPFFDPVTGPAWPSRFDAPEIAFWRGFSYEVRVRFEGSQLAGTAGVPLDADGDTVPEMDLAQIDVEVFWQPVTDPAPERSICKLSTMVGAQDKAPGASSIVDPPPYAEGVVTGEEAADAPP